MRARTGRAIAGAALAGMAGLLLIAATATADTYTVHSCKQPNRSAAATDGWEGFQYGGGRGYTGYANDCPGGGDLAAFLFLPEGYSNFAWSSGAYAGQTFTAPADTRIVAVDLQRSTQGIHPSSASLGYALWAGSQRLEHCIPAYGCADNLAGAARHGGLNAASLTATMSCGGEEDCPNGYEGITPAFHIRHSEITLADNHEPWFTTPPSGTLLDGSRPLSGEKVVSLSAADRGGGLYQARIEVDGREVASQRIDANGGRCQVPYTYAVPCKLTASDSLRVDTAKLSDGAHSVRVIVSDATETNQVTWGPVDITTQNRRPGSGSSSIGGVTPIGESGPLAGIDPVNGVGATAGARIVWGFSGRNRRTIRARYGQRVRIAGRLLGPRGNPIGGADLAVSTRVRTAGAPTAGVAGVRTDRLGRFRVQIPAGPSRVVRVAYRAFAADERYAHTNEVHVLVPSSATLRATPRSLRNGRSVTFRGRLRGRPVPRRGVPVEVQYRGRRGWRTFAVVRSNSRGEFRHRYRFTRTVQPVIFRFRARIREDASYPYALGHSRPVRVRVDG